MAGVRRHDARGIAALARAVCARGDAGLRERARPGCAINSGPEARASDELVLPSPLWRGEHSKCAAWVCAQYQEVLQRAFISMGTIAASLELRSVSDVLTLRTCGAAVSSATKAWKVLRSGATHLRTKSISPDSIQHSRTSGWARTKSSNALRSASAWLVRCTMAKTVTS